MATSELASTLNGQTNVLDKYDQVTYHIKLFMMPQSETAVGKGKPMSVDSSKGTVIAESGVTGKMFIDEVVLKTITNATSAYGNNTALTFDISIREFSGASLLDNIYFSSLTLGIDNYYNTPYFLELTFKGRDPATSMPIDAPLENLKWVWPIKIISTETDVDSGGAFYNIKAVLYDHLGHDREIGKFQKPVNKGIRTVGEAIDAIVKSLNEQQIDKTITDTTLVDVYDIIVPESWRSRAIVVDTEVNIQTGKTNVSVLKAGYRYMAIKAGTSINKAINSILMSTQEYQEEFLNQEEQGSKGPDGKALKGKPRTMHRLDCVTIQGPFDNKRGDYQKTFVYKVIPYEINTLIYDANDLNISSLDRIKRIIGNDTLKKEYNYIFTGLNH